MLENIGLRGKLPEVDTHAHVFTNQLPTAADAVYLVDYNSTPEMYTAMLAGEGAYFGVLVQPSFLGTDNSFMLEAISQNPQRLKGILVLDPTTPIEELRKLSACGICGIRFNVFGKPNLDFSSPQLQQYLHNVKELNWQIELYAESYRLPHILPFLLDAGVEVVVDHFGYINDHRGLEYPGFQYLLYCAESGRVWVKISAWYRLSKSSTVAFKLAKEAAQKLLQHFGPHRLLYGSDWPHTEHENYSGVNGCRLIFDKLVDDLADRETILSTTPVELFGFQYP